MEVWRNNVVKSCGLQDIGWPTFRGCYNVAHEKRQYKFFVFVAGCIQLVAFLESMTISMT